MSEQVEQALSGQLALAARVAEREKTYAKSGSRAEADTAPPEVLVDNDASGSATVIEVHAPDSIGILYKLTQALTGLDLDIRTAKVQTLGHRVVDSFYVRTPGGEKITDPAHLKEIERAILYALG